MSNYEVQDGKVDGSFHSKAYQAQYIASLTARLPEVPASFECLRFQPNETPRESYEDFRAKQKAKEKADLEKAAAADQQTREFRAQLDADRAKRLGGGGGAGGEAKKSKKRKKEKKEKKDKKKKHKKEKKSKKEESSDSDDSGSESSDSGSSDSGSSSDSRKKRKKHKKEKKEKKDKKQKKDAAEGPVALSKFMQESSSS